MYVLVYTAGQAFQPASQGGDSRMSDFQIHFPKHDVTKTIRSDLMSKCYIISSVLGEGEEGFNRKYQRWKLKAQSTCCMGSTQKTLSKNQRKNKKPNLAEKGRENYSREKVKEKVVCFKCFKLFSLRCVYYVCLLLSLARENLVR